MFIQCNGVYSTKIPMPHCNHKVYQDNAAWWTESSAERPCLICAGCQHSPGFPATMTDMERRVDIIRKSFEPSNYGASLAMLHRPFQNDASSSLADSKVADKFGIF